MNNVQTPQTDAKVTSQDLTNGLFVLELEERLEMATLVAAAALSERCDVENAENA